MCARRSVQAEPQWGSCRHFNVDPPRRRFGRSQSDFALQVLEMLTSTSNPDVMVMRRLMRTRPGLSSSRHSFDDALMLTFIKHRITTRRVGTARATRMGNSQRLSRCTIMLNNQVHLCMLP